ncbi:hypothetical protein SADUNF_Sadunf17G0074700 [Salix dunnii]|uniref:Uncharacterized protein n=1 Tax=Salix dunnii TaxID=1413687 RepID=A0A835J322_9ROSI|nr:hypothetical protein SADUNF_Sadunf17G0074700 [Salix dunnii]
MATERESVEKKGSLEVAGKGDEKYQDVGSLYCDEICESIAKKEISSAALVPDESMDSFQSPEYFSFQQELPETDSKGSSMIRESNAEFFSKRTPLSTARNGELVLGWYRMRTEWQLNGTIWSDGKKGSLEDVGSLYFDVICDSIAKKEISSAALVRDESMDSLFYDANEDIESSFRNDHKVRDKLSPTTVEGVIPGTKCSNLMNIARALNIFLFRQELPETESKGSSMIRESNVEFFSKGTPLSTARLEGQSASEKLGAIENGSSLRKGHEPINILPLGIEMQGYRLLWVPLSRAYDMETPFVSPSVMTMLEEKREENIVFEEEIEDENLLATESKPAEVKMYQDENLMATERESVEKKGSLEVAGKDDEKYKDVGSLYCEEICESVARKEISSAALVLDESMDSLFYDAKDDILRHTTVQGVILGTKCSNMMNITRALNIFLFNKNCQTQKPKGIQRSENPMLSSFQQEPDLLMF